MNESLVFPPTFQANSFSSIKTGHNSALPGNLPCPTLHTAGCPSLAPKGLRQAALQRNSQSSGDVQ